MRRSAMIAVVTLSVLILLSAGAYAVYSASGHTPHPSISGLVTNNSYINGLYTDLDLNNSQAIFRHIFSNLEDEVTVYPSENYYYFRFTGSGKTIAGSLNFSVKRIDNGSIGMGYSVKPEDRSRQKLYRMKGGYHEFTTKDGLVIKRANDFRYELTFEGKTVAFNFFDKGLEPPQKAKLRSDEVFVGPSFDESGLRFFLIFNKTVKKLYWVLNEDGFVPEEFTPFSENVVIGDRTEFAFYVDSVHNRKIMVGVQGLNVLHNNWNDGPFDQMPDNFVKTGRIEVKKYLDMHYGYTSERIDKYGWFNGRDDARVPVAPYRVYFDQKELAAVDSLKALNKPEPEFYADITRQIYELPKDYYAGVHAK